MKYLTPKMIEKQFSIKRDTVYWWIRKGIIPYSKIGKNVFIFEKDLKTMMEQSRIDMEELEQ